MKKKIAIVLMLAALTAVPVFAAAVGQTQTPNDRYNQMVQYHQQMVQQAVDSGTLTAEQAAQMNEHMQQMAPFMQQRLQNGGMMGNGGQGCGRFFDNGGKPNT